MNVLLFILSVALLIVGNFLIWRHHKIERINANPTSIYFNIEQGKYKVQINWQDSGLGKLGCGEFEIALVAIHQKEFNDGLATIQIKKNGFNEVLAVDIYMPKGTTPHIL